MTLTPVWKLLKKGLLRRFGLGSWEAVLPKKLSSSMATRPLCESLLPIMPNW
ncbi:hypothetical protein D3C71_1598550 [compost metagenome]